MDLTTEVDGQVEFDEDGVPSAFFTLNISCDSYKLTIDRVVKDQYGSPRFYFSRQS